MVYLQESRKDEVTHTNDKETRSLEGDTGNTALNIYILYY